MENATASPDPEAAARRRSGRVSRAPAKFSPEPANPTKRKRHANGDDDEDDEDVENEDPEDDEEASDASDAEAVSSRRSKSQTSKRANKGSGARRPAIKKPKTNGVSSRNAKDTSLPSRPKKTVAIASFAKPGDDDLYADVFYSSHTVEDVAEQWLRSYNADDARAVKDLVNFVLRSCGCELQITEDDIRDPDNSEARLTELQELYQEEPITEYPLISRAKGTKSFRDLFTEFFHSIIVVLHETETLYKDDVLMENISRWIASMSTSSLRPFRHTATTAILSLVTGLVNAAETLDKRISGIEQQISAAQKNKQKNKAKLAEMNRDLNEANACRERCGSFITDFFDTTFIHRYRDVDSHIRTECIEALGHWIIRLPNVFMEPGYLRYLGWLLSDAVSSTRQEVLRQLGRILKRDADQLGHFIERFQSRLVEMATKDAEVSVRVTALGVVEILRAAGLLQPEEVDAIGRLIFDSEIRVRRAAVNFFRACVEDYIDAKVSEIGGTETLEEVFGEVEDDDLESPRRDWVDIKCLAELMAAYDAAVEEQQQQGAESADLMTTTEFFQGASSTSRIATAAQVLCEKLPVVKEWEQLAGYLLYDHTISAKGRSKSSAKSPQTIVKKAIAPEGTEESVLLEVLAASITMALTQPVEADRNKRKAGRHEVTASQEETALKVAGLIPRFLNKYGADPTTAKIVLRMEHVLNPEVFHQLRQDMSTYEKLLDEIVIQFNRHDDKEVIAEAAVCLLHARKQDEFEEMTDGKLSNLWDNAINSLRNFDKSCELAERGNLSEARLIELSSILAKISNLAKVADCAHVLEARGRSSDTAASAVEILAKIINRGKFLEIDDRIDDLEEEVATFAFKSCQVYFMWKQRALETLVRAGSDIPDDDVEALKRLRTTVQDHLINTFSSRAIVDDIRLLATQCLCDMNILFTILRESIQSSGNSTKYRELAGLAQEITPALLPELISIYDGIERRYARKTKKTLNEPAEDEDPIDDDPSDDEDDDEDLTKDQRQLNEMKDERALCDLAGTYVRAIVCKVVDQSGPYAGRLRKRLLRNQNKLGKNYQEVVAYLNPAKRADLLYGKKNKNAKTQAKKPAAAAKPAQSEEVIVDEAESDNPFDDDGEEDQPEEGSREDLRRRELLEEEEEGDEDEGAQEDAPALPRDDDEDSVIGD